MILRRNAAAVLGTVKCPLVVPSPLSCRLSDALDRAISSSVATRSFSWASTFAWSGSMVSIARRATRRSWSGSNRCAFSTREVSTSRALVVAAPVRQLLGRLDDDRCVRGGEQPLVERGGGGVVPGLEVGGQRDVARRGGSGGVGLPGCPGVGVGEPGISGDAGLVGGGEDLELVGDQPVDRPVDPGDLSGVPGGRNRRGVQLVDQGVQLRDVVDPGTEPVAVGCRGVRWSWINCRTYRCSNQEEIGICGELRA